MRNGGGRRGVRLDRALSKLGAASRAEAKTLILEGRVKAGGRTVTDPAYLVVPGTTRLAIGDTPIATAGWRTIALHKPRGVVTTRRDPEGRRTVFDLIGRDNGALVAVGRLDRASTGLLLLTSDTRLAARLTDPANAIVRRYVVTARGEVGDESVERMQRGIAGLRASTVTVRKRSRRETHLIVELTEGRNREIRRLLEATGHEVTRLLRVAFGGLALGTLQPGEWREVSRAEIREAFPAAEGHTRRPSSLD